MRVYLDNQAATPLLPEVLAAMEPYLRQHYGSASSPHSGGVKARQALNTAREQVAAFIGARSPEEIIFTSNGTEALNLAVKGTAWANKNRGKHIVISAIEHPAVISSAEFLQEHGYSVTKLPVEMRGLVTPSSIRHALRDDTILVAVHHANHDIGTIQLIRGISDILSERGIPFLVDATASAGWIPLNVEEIGASLVALSPHRFYGPKGAGILYKNRRALLSPLITGGVQENNRRAGTENIPTIVGAAVACEIAARRLTDRASHTRRLQIQTWQGLQKCVRGIHLNGLEPGEGRLPNNLNISIEGVEGEGVALSLDMKGIAVSSGAACVTKSMRIPPVLAAIGVPENLAKGNIILSFGEQNTKEEVEGFIEVFAQVVDQLREMSPGWTE